MMKNRIILCIACLTALILISCNILTLQGTGETPVTEQPSTTGQTPGTEQAPATEQVAATEEASAVQTEPAGEVVSQPSPTPLSAVVFPEDSPEAPTALNVALRVFNPLAVERTNAPVTSGVPIPAAMDIRDGGTLRLVDASGAAVPAQFTLLARWGGSPTDPSAPIRWVLLDFQVSLAPGEERFYFLQEGGSPADSPNPQTPVTLTDTETALQISTGAAVFQISKEDGSFSAPGLKAPAVWQWVDGAGNTIGQTSPVELSLTLAGSMRAAVSVKGSLKNDDGTSLDYTTRYWFYAGSPLVRIFHTIENNQLCLLAEYAQPTCHDIGSGGSLNLGDVSLVLQTDLGDDLSFQMGGQGDPQGGSLSAALLLYQDSSGTAYWNRYPEMVDWDNSPLDARPRMQSYSRFSGYQVSLDDQQLETGSQAAGWLTLEGSQGGFSVGVYQFWQNFPKALRAAPDGTIEVSLFPAEFGPEEFDFNLRTGEHKTHELWLAPAVVPLINADPLFATASPEWYVASGAFGMTSLPDWSNWQEHEQYIQYQLDTSPDNAGLEYLPDNVFDTILRTDFYGIFDFGDLPIDYEGYWVSPLNIKYDFDLGMWLQWARSGDPRWFNLALAFDRHSADIDILHNLHEPRHWADGIAFGHSYHDEEGFLNPHRNYGGTAPDTAFGTPGMLLAYYLTGYDKAYESALELADSVEYRVRNDEQLCSYFGEGCNGEGYALMPGMYNAGSRPAANSLMILVAAYRATADQRYLETATALVDWARPEKQPYYNGPTGASGEEDHVRPWMLNLYLRALANYLEMVQEYNLPDEANGQQSYLAFTEWLRTYALLELEPLESGARAAYPYFWWFDERQGDPADEYAVGNNVPSVNNWCYLGADALAYAFILSGDRTYLDQAEAMFRAGAHDPFFQGDPSTYTETKQMINAIVFGNIFLNVWEQAR